jgi:hypothetical protein
VGAHVVMGFAGAAGLTDFWWGMECETQNCCEAFQEMWGQ